MYQSLVSTLCTMLLALVLFDAPALALGPADSTHRHSTGAVTLEDLPSEAREIIVLIRHGGPFRYERDGAVFGNFERALPPRERGYYREYTVPTPGARQRGTRRIVAGRAGDLYYTDDHYRTFRRIRN